MDISIKTLIITVAIIAFVLAIYIGAINSKRKESEEKADRLIGERDSFLEETKPHFEKYTNDQAPLVTFSTTKAIDLLDRIDKYNTATRDLYNDNKIVDAHSVNRVSSMIADLNTLSFALAEKHLRGKIKPALVWAGKTNDYQKTAREAIERERSITYALDMLCADFPLLKAKIAEYSNVASERMPYTESLWVIKREIKIKQDEDLHLIYKIQQREAAFEQQCDRMSYETQQKEATFKQLVEYVEKRKSSSEEIIKSLNRDVEIKQIDTEYKLKLLNDRIEEQRSIIAEKNQLFTALSRPSNEIFGLVPSLSSDLETIEYDISARFLRTKDHPALVEAKRIDELRAQTKVYLEQFKRMQYKYDYLLHLFPELTQYVDGEKELSESVSLKVIEKDMEVDGVKSRLSAEEYRSLSSADRSQLALDRYNTSMKKTKWQIGRDYEMYCGYHLQKLGAKKVIHYGIEKKLDDLGRDLIAIFMDKIHIAQCKYWGQGKLIREKHIMQIYGSTVEYCIAHYGSVDPLHKVVVPLFISPTPLSATATSFAESLGVTVMPLQHGVHPQIKCNINNNEKIYHLPFDQQYDNTEICNTGEFYAFTAKEAEDAGFRRAMRHFNSLNDTVMKNFNL